MAAGRRGANKKTGPKKESKWRKEYFILIPELIRAGKSILQIAKIIKVNPKTIHEWRNKKKELSNSMTKAQDENDCKNSEKSLQQRIKGFRYTETTKEKNSKTGKLETVKTVRKMVIPDVSAIKLHLTNRDRQRWPDKQAVEHGFDSATLELILSALPSEYAESVRKALVAKK